MGGLASLAQAAGHRVTGCDTALYPPMSTQLDEQGIEYIEGYAADQLMLKPDIFVVGNVISRGNPLMEAILDQGALYTSGPQWLSEHILHAKHVLAVAGTHGKTTTSAMLAWILSHAGLNPSFLIGGVPVNFKNSAALAGRFFVIEADEYDTAFFDKRSKFLHYHARTLILNNLEFDHADIFSDLAAIERQFHHLIRTVPTTGQLIVNADSPALARVLQQGYWTPAAFFSSKISSKSDNLNDVTGKNNPDTRANPQAPDWHISQGSAQGFDIFYQGEWQGHIQPRFYGEHNLANALAAIAAAYHVGISPKAAIEALQQFQGVKRRLEKLAEINNIHIYDDFAHHPTAIRATIQALKQHLYTSQHTTHEPTPPPRILAVLEPRSNTMKLGAVKAELADSLKQADAIYCFAPQNGKHALGWNPALALAELGSKAQCFDHLDPLLESVVQLAQPGDHILIMSNGSFGGIHQRIIQGITERAKPKNIAPG